MCLLKWTREKNFRFFSTAHSIVLYRGRQNSESYTWRLMKNIFPYICLKMNNGKGNNCHAISVWSLMARRRSRYISRQAWLRRCLSDVIKCNIYCLSRGNIISMLYQAPTHTHTRICSVVRRTLIAYFYNTNKHEEPAGIYYSKATTTSSFIRI